MCWRGIPVGMARERFEQLEHHDKIMGRIAMLRAQGATAQKIADDLNAEGRAPAKKATFDALIVQKLLGRKMLGTQRPMVRNRSPSQR